MIVKTAVLIWLLITFFCVLIETNGVIGGIKLLVCAILTLIGLIYLAACIDNSIHQVIWND